MLRSHGETKTHSTRFLTFELPTENSLEDCPSEVTGYLSPSHFNGLPLGRTPACGRRDAIFKLGILCLQSELALLKSKRYLGTSDLYLYQMGVGASPGKGLTLSLCAQCFPTTAWHVLVSRLQHQELHLSRSDTRDKIARSDEADDLLFREQIFR